MKEKLKPEVFEDKQFSLFEDKQFPHHWRVEWIGENGDCYVTVFSGPFAEKRANDYKKYAEKKIREQEDY